MIQILTVVKLMNSFTVGALCDNGHPSYINITRGWYTSAPYKINNKKCYRLIPQIVSSVHIYSMQRAHSILQSPFSLGPSMKLSYSSYLCVFP